MQRHCHEAHQLVLLPKVISFPLKILFGSCFRALNFMMLLRNDFFHTSVQVVNILRVQVLTVSLVVAQGDIGIVLR